jgi:hypothetical protein
MQIKPNKELDQYGANVDFDPQVQALLNGFKGNDVLAIKVVIKQGPTTKDNLSEAIVAFKYAFRSSNNHENREH